MKPKTEQASKPERMTITWGQGQRHKIEEIAKDRRTSVATVIRWAVDEYIEAQAICGDRNHK